MTWLLDGNILVALAIDTHQFHERAKRWFDVQTEPFATCAISEGTLLRVYLRLAADPRVDAAWALLKEIHAMQEHEFWDAGFSFCSIETAHVKGWGDVTDAWLAELARRKEGRLATMDEALVAKHGDVAFLVPE